MSDNTELPPDDPRGGIDARLLIDALQAHALGDIKMTATQVSAATTLLKKILPDLPAAKRDKDDDKTITHEEALEGLECEAV